MNSQLRTKKPESGSTSKMSAPTYQLPQAGLVSQHCLLGELCFWNKPYTKPNLAAQALVMSSHDVLVLTHSIYRANWVGLLLHTWQRVFGDRRSATQCYQSRTQWQCFSRHILHHVSWQTPAHQKNTPRGKKKREDKVGGHSTDM